jgi:hypothetical protein
MKDVFAKLTYAFGAKLVAFAVQYVAFRLLVPQRLRAISA